MWRMVFLATASLALVATARAHHVPAVHLAGRHLQLGGVVQEFRWTNPRDGLLLVVAGPGRDAGEWRLDGAPVLQMARAGWARGSLRPGDRVVVDCREAGTGGHAARIVGIRRAGDAGPAPGAGQGY